MAREKGKKKLIRLNMELSTDMRARLNKMVEATDAASQIEVIRKALGVYEWVLAEEASGAELQAVRRDGSVTRVKLLF